MNKLWVRLSLAFTTMVLVAVVIVVLTGYIVSRFESDDARFASWVLERSGGLINLLEDYYQQHRNWAGVAPIMSGAQTTLFKSDTSYVLVDRGNVIIYHARPDLIGQPASQTNLRYEIPLKVNNQPVGYLGFASVPAPAQDGNRRPPFLRDLVQTLLVLAAVGGVAGAIFGVVMSRSVTAPLNDLAHAARAIGARKLNQRVTEKGTDEIIAVTRAFNDMASDLEEAETLRRNLLADVAHELRTPLSVLQGNLRAILDEVYPLDLDEMGRLYEQTRLLSRLVNDLHELAQAEAHQLPLNLQETDLSQLARSTVAVFRPDAEEKQVELAVNLAENLPSTRVDTARISQVLHNLLANALRHTPAGGRITLNVEPAEQSVSVSVSDTGEGIAPEHLPHIFDRFYRTDPARSRDVGGAGLGLAIARAIVEAHHGHLTAFSGGVGQGTTFTMQLPA